MSTTEQRRDYQRRYYLLNRDKLNARAKQWSHDNLDRTRDRRRQQSRDYYEMCADIVRKFKSRPCMDCGVQYPPYVMDLDHRDPLLKTRNVGSMVGTCRPETLLAEIAKCDLVCANCHRIRTQSRLAARRSF